MDNIKCQLNKMYYVPPVYYWIDKDIYSYVYHDLTTRLNENKEIYNKFITNSNTKNIEKGPEYNEYKSNLIRVILLKYTHENPDKKSINLLEDIFKKWKENKNIREKNINLILERSISNIIKFEKNINNIEQIMMSINLYILEHYMS